MFANFKCFYKYCLFRQYFMSAYKELFQEQNNTIIENWYKTLPQYSSSIG